MSIEQIFLLINSKMEQQSEIAIECYELAYTGGWNEAIEAAVKWLETANRNDTDDAAEIRKLKR